MVCLVFGEVGDGLSHLNYNRAALYNQIDSELMSVFTSKELTQIKEERNLDDQQLLALQNAANTYSGKVTK